MLVIKLDEISSELSSLHSIIDNYEENYKMIFKELEDSKISWYDDDHSKAFYDDVIIENYQNKEHNNNLRQIESIYQYLLDKYKEIGNKIEVDLNYVDSILTKYNDRISEIRDIINQYKGVDTYYCPRERNYINNQIKDLRATITNMRKSKQKYKDLFEKIENIEKNTREKLDKIDIFAIKEMIEDKYFNIEGEK